MRIADRIAKLEARRGGRQAPRIVLRHVIEGATPGERQAKASHLAAAHDQGVFHVFRMVVDPTHV